MLEIKTLQIMSKENENDYDFKKTRREIKTPKILNSFLEMYENVNATTKEILILNSKGVEIQIDFNFKNELEKIENQIKELETQQENLTYKAYCEIARQLANDKKSLFDKYSILNIKVEAYEIENYILVNSLTDFVKCFENFIDRKYKLTIHIK